MAKWTIAQLRQKEIDTLAGYIAGEDAHDKASYIMHSFYRLAALNMRNFEDSNNATICENPRLYKRLEKSENRAQAWGERLNKLLLAYGLKLDFPGLYPYICKNDSGKNGAVIISGNWYD